MSAECNIVDYANVSYKEFNALKNDVQRLNEIVDKAVDLGLTLSERISQLHKNSLTDFEYLDKRFSKVQVKSDYIQSLDKDIESLWEYVEKMSNHIKELERSKKGFIRRFFDKFRLIKHDDLDIKKHKSKQKFTLNDD